MYTRAMNLEDQLVHHIPVQNAAQHPNVFGLEVELEGKKIKAIPDKVALYWHPHVDNSLRQLKLGDEAIEYVSRTPCDLQMTEKSITELFNYLNSPGVEVYESYRTSIHVHVNFAIETFRTIYNFMTLSLIFDELLVSQNGDHRVGNNFCLRAKDALGQVIDLCASIESGSAFFGVSPNNRYSSINFASLMKFGSIEFRSLECTTHQGRLMHWIGTLQAMKEKAKTFKNPVDVIAKFSQLGPREFLSYVLGPYAIKYQSVSGADKMLLDGMRIAQDLAYCASWKETQ